MIALRVAKCIFCEYDNDTLLVVQENDWLSFHSASACKSLYLYMWGNAFNLVIPPDSISLWISLQKKKESLPKRKPVWEDDDDEGDSG